MAKKWRPKYNPDAIEFLLAYISDHILTYEESKELEKIKYDDDDIVVTMLRKFCGPLYFGESKDSQNIVRNALAEAIEDPNYNYNLIWSGLVFPFAYPDGIPDPERFLGLLWKALFDEDFTFSNDNDAPFTGRD